MSLLPLPSKSWGATKLKAHIAPVPLLSCRPPTMAVLPSPDSATDVPCPAFPPAPLPTSLWPCWLHTPPLRLKTQTAPNEALSLGPPTMAVLPSSDSPTDVPCTEPPTAPVPTRFEPCCVHTPPLRVNTHVDWKAGPPTRAVLPSADSAT